MAFGISRFVRIEPTTIRRGGSSFILLILLIGGCLSGNGHKEASQNHSHFVVTQNKWYYGPAGETITTGYYSSEPRQLSMEVVDGLIVAGNDTFCPPFGECLIYSEEEVLNVTQDYGSEASGLLKEMLESGQDGCKKMSFTTICVKDGEVVFFGFYNRGGMVWNKTHLPGISGSMLTRRGYVEGRENANLSQYPDNIVNNIYECDRYDNESLRIRCLLAGARRWPDHRLCERIDRTRPEYQECVSRVF